MRKLLIGQTITDEHIIEHYLDKETREKYNYIKTKGIDKIDRSSVLVSGPLATIIGFKTRNILIENNHIYINFIILVVLAVLIFLLHKKRLANIRKQLIKEEDASISCTEIKSMFLKLCKQRFKALVLVFFTCGFVFLVWMMFNSHRELILLLSMDILIIFIVTITFLIRPIDLCATYLYLKGLREETPNDAKKRRTFL